jgi:hypothetical protein
MKLKRIAFLIATILLSTAFIRAQDKPKIEASQRYLLLATTKTGTMQKELDEAAALGFRVIVGSPTAGAEMAIFLERVAQPPDTYQYRLLATTRTSTMEKELNEAAREGFRLLPRTMISKARLVGAVEIVTLLERTPNSEKRYEYKLLATNRTSTLQKEVAEAQAAGYVLAGMVSRDEHMVIMEREAPISR